MLKKLDLYVSFSQKLVCVYRRDFDETAYMSFLIKDDESLEKYNEILEKKNLIVNQYIMKNI